MFCLGPLRTIWLKWNDLWKLEWASVWPSSRAQTWSSWSPAEERVRVTYFRLLVNPFLTVCSLTASMQAVDERAETVITEVQTNTSCHHFRAKCVSVIPRSKKNPYVTSHTSHSSNPYHVSLQFVTLLALYSLANSTSDISLTAKSSKPQQGETSGQIFQNKTSLNPNVSWTHF